MPGAEAAGGVTGMAAPTREAGVVGVLGATGFGGNAAPAGIGAAGLAGAMGVAGTGAPGGFGATELAAPGAAMGFGGMGGAV
jgi:hypothetical protein